MRGTLNKNRFNTRNITNSNKPQSVLNVNRTAHGALHKPKILIYGSGDALSTLESTAFYSPYNGRIVWASAVVQGAPTGTLQVDIKVNGVRLWDTADYLTINAGELVSKYMKRPVNSYRIIGIDDPVSAATPITAQIVTIAGATGPMTLFMGVMW